MDLSQTIPSVPTISPTAQDNESTTNPTTTSPHVDVDCSKATSDYANTCRISGMPEELLIDFGVQIQSTAITMQRVAVTQRVVTSWHTAKRLVQVLHMAIERHEATFGVLETDVQKRAGGI